MLRPAPKPPRVRGVKTKPKNVEPVVIQPKALAQNAGPTPPSAFVLSRSSKPGKLILRFQANQPKLAFDPHKSFVIQLNTVAPLELTPSLITRFEWPKNGAMQMEIGYQGAKPNQDNVILGKAAFTTCVTGTKKCSKQKVPLVFHLR